MRGKVRPWVPSDEDIHKAEEQLAKFKAEKMPAVMADTAQLQKDLDDLELEKVGLYKGGSLDRDILVKTAEIKSRWTAIKALLQQGVALEGNVEMMKGAKQRAWNRRRFFK